MKILSTPIEVLASSREEQPPMLIPNKPLGQNIAHHRKERKLSQAKLAAIAHMDPNHFYCIETGRKYPQICILAQLAAGLGVSIGELVNNE
jgi:transcriptional regulator with XRE-family HTH domain